jgi:hypothetical protein
MSENSSTLKFSAYTDSSLQFFYLDVVGDEITPVKGLPKAVSRKMQRFMEKIKPQADGRKYFEQIFIDGPSGANRSYNDFTEPTYFANIPNSLLVDASSDHTYKFASKGLAGGPSMCGPLYSTIYWLLGKLFAVDPRIIAAYTFFDACTQIDDDSIPFTDFTISDLEKEKLLFTKRDIPCFHGVNIFTHERWQNRDPVKWECFDWLQTIEDAALLGAHKTGSTNLIDVRPNLEWLHEKFIESELKNIMGKK